MNRNVPAAQGSGFELSVQAMFGPPPLVTGEDPAAYQELLVRISGAVKPKDFLEEIWVRDVIDLTWDCLRMRRLKASLLTSATNEGRDELAMSQMARPQIKQWDAPMAQALALRIDQFERIDRMIMNTEARRNAALREVDRHRSNLAQALRQASDDVIEAEFEDVPQQRAQKDAA